jgi:hypothetical protein
MIIGDEVLGGKAGDIFTPFVFLLQSPAMLRRCDGPRGGGSSGVPTYLRWTMNNEWGFWSIQLKRVQQANKTWHR